MYPELKVPHQDDVHFGAVMVGGGGRFCLDTLGQDDHGGPVGIYTCHGSGGNQEWSLTKAGYIKHAVDYCLTPDSSQPGASLRIKMCKQSYIQASVVDWRIIMVVNSSLSCTALLNKSIVDRHSGKLFIVCFILQEFEFDVGSGRIRHRKSDLCLDAGGEQRRYSAGDQGIQLTLADCDASSNFQHWKWKLAGSM